MGSWTAVEEHILGELAGVDHPVILVANKQDQLAADRQQVFLQEVATRREFAEVIGVSALQGTGLDTLVDSIVQRLEEGPQYYPEDWITDHPERFVIAEFIREELLTRTEEEIPHSIAVDVDEIKEDPKKNLMRIRATIYVERESQKGIVIGKEGKMLKEVGTGARLQIEGLLGIRVYLDLWVKVKKDWRNKPGALREFGYE
jgi:GTP-binding protein Era